MTTEPIGQADAGGFEAVVTRGFGVAARTGPCATWLTGLSRVAVDVVHAEPGTGAQLLRPGDVGAWTWQWRLVEALDRQLAVDEHFGAVTEGAIRDFQRVHRLSIDGIAWPPGIDQLPSESRSWTRSIQRHQRSVPRRNRLIGARSRRRAPGCSST